LAAEDDESQADELVVKPDFTHLPQRVELSNFMVRSCEGPDEQDDREEDYRDADKGECGGTSCSRLGLCRIRANSSFKVAWPRVLRDTLLQPLLITRNKNS
jgi:hypothetical protein